MILNPHHENTVEDLLEIYAVEGGPVGRLAAIVADLVGELGATTLPDLVDLLPAQRLDLVVDRLQEIAARVLALELALTETNRRVPASAPKPAGETLTLFGIPVVLAGGTTEEQIRDAVSTAPKGLSGKQVAEYLTAAGLVRVVE